MSCGSTASCRGSNTYPHSFVVRVSRQVVYEFFVSLRDPSPALLEEWLIYVQYNCDDLPNPFHVNDFWKGVHARFPNLGAIAMQAIWMPVASVDVERAFISTNTY